MIDTYIAPKKNSLIILGVTSVLLSRVMFLFFDDPEGPNLLVVFGMAFILYFLSLVVFLFNSQKSISKRLLLTIFTQIILATIFTFY